MATSDGEQPGEPGLQEPALLTQPSLLRVSALDIISEGVPADVGPISPFSCGSPRLARTSTLEAPLRRLASRQLSLPREGLAAEEVQSGQGSVPRL